MVRRSGRERTVSTRLKDMVTSKISNGHHSRVNFPDLATSEVVEETETVKPLKTKKKGSLEVHEIKGTLKDNIENTGRLSKTQKTVKCLVKKSKKHKEESSCSDLETDNCNERPKATPFASIPAIQRSVNVENRITLNTPSRKLKSNRNKITTKKSDKIDAGKAINRTIINEETLCPREESNFIENRRCVIEKKSVGQVVDGPDVKETHNDNSANKVSLKHDNEDIKNDSDIIVVENYLDDANSHIVEVSTYSADLEIEENVVEVLGENDRDNSPSNTVEVTTNEQEVHSIRTTNSNLVNEDEMIDETSCVESRVSEMILKNKNHQDEQFLDSNSTTQTEDGLSLSQEENLSSKPDDTNKDTSPASLSTLVKNANQDIASSSSGKSNDGSKAIALVAASYNINEFSKATVTEFENGELLLSFGEQGRKESGDETDVSQLQMVIPRWTAEGWECTVSGCNYTTNKRVNWYKHQKVHTGTKAHPCDQCSYVAKTTSNLKRHQMIHTNVKQFVCHFCEDSFRQKIHLMRHIRYKHESKRIQCGYCEYRCSSVNPDLRIHMRRRHLIHVNEEAARALFSCKECGFVAPSKKDLAQHMKFHSTGPELKLFCDYCSFVTDCSSRLIRHMLIHTKEKPYQCGLCDYRASQKAHVLRHMQKKHTLEVQKFIVPQNLQEHASNQDIDSVDNSVATEPKSTSSVSTLASARGNNNMDASSNPQTESTESVIPPTADVIRDGFRVLMDDNEENSVVIIEPNDHNRDHSSQDAMEQDTVNALQNDSSDHGLTTANPSSESQAKKSVAPSNSAAGFVSQTRIISSPMVSLFQPNELARDKIYKCPHCTMKFSKTLNLHKHLELQHKVVQPLSCCLCSYKTDKKANLLIHLRKHNMPRKQYKSVLNIASRSARSLLPVKKTTQTHKKTTRAYNCTICGHTEVNLQNLFRHIELRHSEFLNRFGKQEPGAFSVVEDLPSNSHNPVDASNTDPGYHKVMVEMWPGSPAQIVDIEQPWHHDATKVSSEEGTELLEGLQALANQASNANALTVDELNAVCGSSSDKPNNIQMPAEQLMKLSSGDFIQIDGEMYKVEFSE